MKEILLLPPCLIGYLGKGGSMVTRLRQESTWLLSTLVLLLLLCCCCRCCCCCLKSLLTIFCLFHWPKFSHLYKVTNNILALHMILPLGSLDILQRKSLQSIFLKLKRLSFIFLFSFSISTDLQHHGLAVNTQVSKRQKTEFQF